MTIYALRVKPKVKKPKAPYWEEGDEEGLRVLVVETSAPPVDGKANEDVIARVAEFFGVKKRDVAIRTGAGARHKRVEVAD